MRWTPANCYTMHLYSKITPALEILRVCIFPLLLQIFVLTASTARVIDDLFCVVCPVGLTRRRSIDVSERHYLCSIKDFWYRRKENSTEREKEIEKFIGTVWCELFKPIYLSTKPIPKWYICVILHVVSETHGFKPIKQKTQIYSCF